MTVAATPVIDVLFGISAGRELAGAVIPADHGYALFGALSRVLPWLHGNAAVGIHALRGRLAGGQRLHLAEPARLAFRVPAELLPALLPLAGKALEVGDVQLRVGTPSIAMLRPAERLTSRLVIIKGGQEPESFLRQARAQLAALGIEGEPRLLRRRALRPFEGAAGGRGEWVRRTLRIQDRIIVGYALEVTGLTVADSLRLQAVGLGGRRRFGCGLFVPAPGTRR
jgi:CRISPR-associated protein Cas6